jgi:transposase
LIDFVDDRFMIDVVAIRGKYKALEGVLDERGRRLWAAAEARSLGRGGFTAVIRATGLSSATLTRGLEELDAPAALEPGRSRKAGGGRKSLVASDPKLTADLESMVEPLTRGDPQSPLRWTCLSTRNLAAQLQAMGHRISHMSVARLLPDLGYSLQSNRKTREGGDHPDRNAQFQHINALAADRLAKNLPVISVDAKKKELVGDFKNNGREWRPKGRPQEVQVHDFPKKDLGKAIPYGVYDMGRNDGWVSVGVDHDTACFAVATIRRWWQRMGRPAYPNADSILITADGGGSNGSRVKLWKWELQKWADESGLTIHVCHLPPGTSKWNKIEHRLFSFISQNWRGRPLLTHALIIDLISSTTTAKGLKVACELDHKSYPRNLKVTKAQMKTINIAHDTLRALWNYTIKPRKN